MKSETGVEARINIVLECTEMSTHAHPMMEGDWDVLSSNAQTYTHRSGDLILSKGSPNKNLYRVGMGSYEVLREDGTPVAILGVGDTFGEYSFLGKYDLSLRAPCSFDVTVVQVCGQSKCARCR